MRIPRRVLEALGVLSVGVLGVGIGLYAANRPDVPGAAGGTTCPSASPTPLASASPSPSSSPVVFGASDNSADDIARHAGQMLPPVGARVYLTALPARWVDSAVLAAVPAADPVTVSFKTGTPAQLAAFLAGKPPGQQAHVTYYHEPEDNFTTTAQQTAYRASWGTYAPVIRAAGDTPTLILMAYTLKAGSGRDYRSWFNPTAVDAIGWDMYNSGNKANPPSYVDPAKLLAPIVANAKVTGLPWGVTETGSPIISTDPTGSVRAAWAGKLAAALKADGATTGLWWDSGSGSGFDSTLDAQTAAAWR